MSPTWALLCRGSSPFRLYQFWRVLEPPISAPRSRASACQSPYRGPSWSHRGPQINQGTPLLTLSVVSCGLSGSPHPTYPSHSPTQPSLGPRISPGEVNLFVSTQLTEQISSLPNPRVPLPPSLISLTCERCLRHQPKSSQILLSLQSFSRLVQLAMSSRGADAPRPLPLGWTALCLVLQLVFSLVASAE